MPISVAPLPAERSRTRQLLDQLDDGERRCLALRYGLGVDGPLPLEAAALSLGLTPQQCRLLESRALARLGALLLQARCAGLAA